MLAGVCLAVERGGLEFLGESKYLLWLNVAALLISLIVLFRRSRQSSYVPVVTGGCAGLLILTGKFLLNSNPMAWLGAAALLAAFAWSSSKAKLARCRACVGDTSLEVVNHGIKES